jgi:radical SAM superfamily enzyme YgiQ (UPF0313 family)
MRQRDKFEIPEEMAKVRREIAEWRSTRTKRCRLPERLWEAAAYARHLPNGWERGDPEMQKVINKNLDLGRVRAVVAMTRKAGIDVRCSFMFGNQCETPQTMQRTIDFARELAPDFASFNIATPYPGTYLRSWAIENGYLANRSYEALDSTSYTLVTNTLPPGTVERYCDRAFRTFYSSTTVHATSYEGCERFVIWRKRCGPPSPHSTQREVCHCSQKPC